MSETSPGRRWLMSLAVVVCGWFVASFFFFDEDNITPLGGHYFTASYDNGPALHWYEDESRPYSEPLLDKVYSTQISGPYLVACASTNVFFMYPLHATSQQEVQEKQLGPFDKSELQGKLLELTGDSTLHQVILF